MSVARETTEPGWLMAFLNWLANGPSWLIDRAFNVWMRITASVIVTAPLAPIVASVVSVALAPTIMKLWATNDLWPSITLGYLHIPDKDDQRLFGAAFVIVGIFVLVACWLFLAVAHFALRLGSVREASAPTYERLTARITTLASQFNHDGHTSPARRQKQAGRRGNRMLTHLIHRLPTRREASAGWRRKSPRD